MQTSLHAASVAPISNQSRWIGRVLSGLAVAFLIFDTAIKVLNTVPAIEATTGLGYAENVVFGLGVLELVCLAVYLFPRTAILGAVLMTGYLGGAVATHVRAGSDTFSLVFPVIIGALLWGGLWLRDERLRVLIALKG